MEQVHKLTKYQNVFTLLSHYCTCVRMLLSVLILPYVSSHYYIEQVHKLTKDQNVSLTDEHLVVLRRGIEGSKAVSMGIIAFVGSRVTETSFYQPGTHFYLLYLLC